MTVETVRRAIAKRIAENPVTVIVSVYGATIDNGYGIQVPNLAVPAVPATLGIGLVSRRRLPDPLITNAKTPYDHLDVYYIIVKHTDAWLTRGIVFAYNGRKYRVLLPEDRVIFGAVAYRLADLEDVTSSDVGDEYV